MTDDVGETRFHIELDRCQGHGRCYSLAPDFFDVDDEGRGVVKATDVSTSQLGSAEVVVQECPERAISMVGADPTRE
ncbi:ferredoxin [Mycobacterium sp.]|uniref:ferredoxin n=1 Tax=Mycobacterium sp. TaxID=1785 RepID=UPI003BB18E93